MVPQRPLTMGYRGALLIFDVVGGCTDKQNTTLAFQLPFPIHGTLSPRRKGL